MDGRSLRSRAGALGAGDPGALEALFGDAPELLGEAEAPPQSLPELAPGGQASLVEAYRHRGHLRARLDPLGLAPLPEVAELDPAAHGLDPARAARLVDRLRATYCGAIGWEFGHIHDPTRRAWLAAAAEETAGAMPDPQTRLWLLSMLARAWTFEDMLRGRFPGTKVFGIEGAESFLILIEAAIAESAGLGAEEVVIGGMHRGRLNMLATVLDKPLPALMAEVMGRSPLPDGVGASSDVPYHLGWSSERTIAGRRVHLTLSPHPSHLQVVPLVALGRARGKQDRRARRGLTEPQRAAVLPLLVHTDASFAGQGIVAEMFQLARLAPYTTGGAIHLVLDNQVGFTTDPHEGRSARYPTDIAKMVEAPVIHVNGDEPEAVWHAALTAARYRARFGLDVVVRLIGYRRFGHNELEEPRLTQPLMYRAIDRRPPIHRLYAGRLGAQGLDTAPAERAAADWRAALDAAHRAARAYRPNTTGAFAGAWSGFHRGTDVEMTGFTDTGLAEDRLRGLAAQITAVPEGLDIDPKVVRFLDQRRGAVGAGEGINWASAEALALASLLAEGTPIRLGGQDTVRGAFAQRHLTLHEPATGRRHMVLAAVAAAAGVRAEVFNSPLVEYAVVAFEYGLSLADPAPLVLWEAQFGDFLNLAQPVFDQCIVCGEDRWLRSSGLVLLLPHGHDGGGADHSTAHPERLLAACARGNIQVVNASTPANYFHLLRRQVRRPFRKPLIVLTPKALLRHKACVSRLAEFGPGTGFRAVLSDDGAHGARRAVLCAGKVFHDLAEARAARGRVAEVALIRIEQLSPFSAEALRQALAAHSGADLVWCQEEPANMGYFDFVRPRIEAVAGRVVAYAGRPASPTPSVGVKAWLEAEKAGVIDAALG